MMLAKVRIEDSSENCTIELHKILCTYHLQILIAGEQYTGRVLGDMRDIYKSLSQLITVLSQHKIDDLIQEFRQDYGEGQYYIGEIAHYYYNSKTRQILAPLVLWKLLECRILGE